MGLCDEINHRIRLHPFHQSGDRSAKVGATRAEEIKEFPENFLGGDDPHSTEALANADRKGVCLVPGIEQGDPVEGIGENAAHQPRLGAAQR